MAMSLKLQSSAELSGNWRLFVQSRASEFCELHLATQTPELSGDFACASAWLSSTPAGWFPTPDGLAFTRQDGSGLVHFSRLGDQRYQTRLPNGDLLNLERVAE